MRTTVIGLVLVATLALAAAEVEPRSKWIAFDHKQLGVHVLRPPSAKVAVHGSELTITGKDLPTVAIAMAQTTERLSGKNGGVKDLKVSWTITAPRRSATCTAVAADQDQATVASQICESIEVTATPRTPHAEISVETKGLSDGAAYEKAVRAKAHQFDACWRTALAKDKDMPEGEVELRRSYDHGQPSGTSENHRNFFDHDAKPLGACMTDLIKAVPVKTTGDAAEIKINVICQLY